MHLNSYAAELRLHRIRGRARLGDRKMAGSTVEYRHEPNPTVVTANGEAPDEGGNNPAGVERRGSTRVPLERDIVVRRIGGFNFDVGIRNLSVGGCTIDAIEEYEVGDPVITRFPQLEPLGSRVCWTNGSTVGIQFLRAIHPAVLNSLVERLV